MAENAELEDLDQLVTCPGWGRFLKMVDQQWGAAGERYTQAITNAARIGADADAMSQLRQIVAAQREIQTVMQMIPNRLHRLKQVKQAQSVPELAGSRRGGL